MARVEPSRGGAPQQPISPFLQEVKNDVVNAQKIVYNPNADTAPHGIHQWSMGSEGPVVPSHLLNHIPRNIST